MTIATARPTRREQRRAQTVQEIKALAMAQISVGGPDAVSLSGIVREMSMSPAAIYRYFESRDALLGDLVVDAYDEFADFIDASASSSTMPEEHLGAVLHAARTWALEHPNAYRLIFQSTLGSGQELAAERTRTASTRSMAAIVAAIAAVAGRSGGAVTGADLTFPPRLTDAIEEWSSRVGLSSSSPEVLALGLTSWTRLHGVISLELGGHLAATGLDPAVLYDAEVAGITRAASSRAAASSDLP